jgi:hypothetical protein
LTFEEAKYFFEESGKVIVEKPGNSGQLQRVRRIYKDIVLLILLLLAEDLQGKEIQHNIQTVIFALLEIERYFINSDLLFFCRLEKC